MIIINKYLEPEKFAEYWKLRNQEKVKIVYWAGSLYFFEKIERKIP